MRRNPSVERFMVHGLKVVAAPDPRAPAVVTHLALKGGARLDPPAQNGLSHLCEHLLYAGLNPQFRRRYPELTRRVGGSSVARTWYDHISFTDILPACHLSLGLWLAVDRLCHRGESLDARTVRSEREVLLQERRQQTAGNFHVRPLEEIHRLLFPEDHPYHRPPIGTPQGLASIRPDDVRRHLEGCLNPTTAVLVVVGDIQPKTLRQWLAELEPLEPVGMDSQNSPARPPIPTTQRGEITTPMALPSLYLGCTVTHPESPEVAVLATLLAAGPDSRLSRRLVGKGLATGVRAHCINLGQLGTLVVAMTAAPGMSLQRLEEAASAELERLAVEIETAEEEIETARWRAYRDVAIRMDRWPGRAESFAEAALRSDSGEPLHPEELLAVTPQALGAVLRDTMPPQHRVWLSVQPDGGHR